MDGYLGMSELRNMCKQNGVDLDTYDLVGFTFYDGETIGRYPISITMLLVKKDEYTEEGQSTNVYRKRLSMNYEELGKCIKRLCFGVAYKGISSRITTPNFIEIE